MSWMTFVESDSRVAILRVIGGSVCLLRIREQFLTAFAMRCTLLHLQPTVHRMQKAGQVVDICFPAPPLGHVQYSTVRSTHCSSKKSFVHSQQSKP